MPQEELMVAPGAALAAQPVKRLKIRFPSADSFQAALASESTSSAAKVVSSERRTISVDVPLIGGAAAESVPLDHLVHHAGPAAEVLLEQFGAEVSEDFQYWLEQEGEFFGLGAVVPEVAGAQSLDDVTALIRAREAWAESRGRDVVIAVVDTGINGARPEFPLAKRFGQSWAPQGENAWTDWEGHGTMCAAVAAGTSEEGGAFDGVAPDAAIMACRTYYYDSELAEIYALLRDLARAGTTVVASNSFGYRSGTPPTLPPDSDFPDALDQAIEAGVYVFFSAGNYHLLAGGDAASDSPSSIWLYKCRDDVLTVGASRPDGTIWDYSSRGPGQHHGEAGTNRKPDVVGATPPDGRIVYGGRVVSMPIGWGTSGCCPQAAGLAALMLSKRPGIPRDELFEAIRGTAVSLGHSHEMQGRGLIDCVEALARV